ncbi:MAG: sulfatase-like hydrolase/transferase [Cyclobacteriaceae bacterium]|nr:sulfatase-like hydrolase/transferase [Cyclobacteriaceae bacterium]
MKNSNFKLLAFFILGIISINNLVGQNQKPNIVFILADDLGWGDLSCYGHPYSKTPALDKMATQGIRFERFYVTGVTCCPSRTGFMTSRHPASYPKYMAEYGFAGKTTVTEIFKNNGYTTGHFGKWHIGSKNSEKSGTYGIDEVQVIGGNNSSDGGRDADLFEAAIKFIEKNKDKPFYVNIWGHITHYAVDPVSSLVVPFKDVQVKRSDFGKHMQQKFDDCESLGGDIEESMRNYSGDVYSLDIQVGRVLKKLEELGLSENTIVIFSSDQGPAPVIVGGKNLKDKYKVIGKNTGICPSENMLGYAGGLRGGKHTQWEGGVRSPLIVRWQGKIPENIVNSSSIVSGIDYLPTICNLAGIDYENEGFEGEDMSKVILGEKGQRTTPLFWRTSSGKANPSMLDGNWKLHRKGQKYELYDLSVDEKEMNNVADKYPAKVKELSKQMEDWNSTLPMSYLKKKN